jgi:hypothetical protein
LNRTGTIHTLDHVTESPLSLTLARLAATAGLSALSTFAYHDMLLEDIDDRFAEAAP